MTLKHSALSVKILLRLSRGMISKKYVTNLYGRYKKEDRDEAINGLLEQGLIESIELPKPGANKAPTFYKITEKGALWLDDYMKNYPKQ